MPPTPPQTASTSWRDSCHESSLSLRQGNGCGRLTRRNAVTNAHTIALVFSDLSVDHVEPGYSPFIVVEGGAPGAGTHR
ncbi:hypothetical protein ACPZ19_07005 [Amycolatopsis lurida]